ncbi:MAG: hypothetical protein J6T01_01000 [Kiritimatiellae bacterium]|nr:hypothetical protein [Kiritimatiellia bacterium]
MAVMLMATGAARAEAWFVPGWMRTSRPESEAWTGFTNVFGRAETRFWNWDGDRMWPTAAANADVAAGRMADEIAGMGESRRARLTIVGHSLGARLTARALSRIGDRGIKIKQGVLLAPAVRNDDPELKGMGRGSTEPVILLVNPQDITLKYVYAIAGGEGGRALGNDGVTDPLANVREYSVPTDITDTTEIAAAWGGTEAVKRIANHHAAFYFAELKRILAGEPSVKAQVRVPQDLVNVELKVADAGIWWDVLDSAQDWKLERNIVTGHCRIIDPDKRRVAWGAEADMRRSLETVRRQLNRPSCASDSTGDGPVKKMP